MLLLILLSTLCKFFKKGGWVKCQASGFLNKQSSMRIIIIFNLLFFFGVSCMGQDLSQDSKHWYLTSFNIKLSRSNIISAKHLSSFEVDSYALGFMQNELSFNHKFGEAISGTLGTARSTIYGQRSSFNYWRVHVAATYKLKLGALRMANTIRYENYRPGLQKFSSRVLLTNKWKYYNKKWPLRISPYIKNQLYYYSGGSEITYWLPDEEVLPNGADYIEQAPNGWHRYRFTTGLRMRIQKGVYLSLFYTLQKEFNTPWSPYRGLHVPNKSRTRIKRPFNNYHLLGLSLSINLKLY